MAMLAEKKRKTKWCLNPMGNDWAKDENKFGQKMLEKMGWSPGTGLGANGQGRTEIIKLSVKNDTKGLGSSQEDESDYWTSNLEKYDNLLAQLNGNQKEEVQPQALPSLEEKSKRSRARVHYHKFTRGKDVSKYSHKDLNCILPIGNGKNEETDENAQHPTVNNMYAYFSNKVKNPYKESNKRELNSPDNTVECHNIQENESANLNEEENQLSIKRKLSDEQTDIKDQFVKKKKRKAEEMLNNEINNSIGSEAINEYSDKNITMKTDDIEKKKKKKQVRFALDAPLSENTNDCSADIDTHCSDKVISKKKKRKAEEMLNNEINNSIGSEAINEYSDKNITMKTDDIVKKKKKKQVRFALDAPLSENTNDCSADIDTHCSDKVISKKKKKKKKGQNDMLYSTVNTSENDQLNFEDVANDEDASNTNEKLKKNKKKKKKSSKCVAEEAEVSREL